MVHCHRRHSSKTLSHLNRERESHTKARGECQTTEYSRKQQFMVYLFQNVMTPRLASQYVSIMVVLRTRSSVT